MMFDIKKSSLQLEKINKKMQEITCWGLLTSHNGLCIYYLITFSAKFA